IDMTQIRNTVGRRRKELVPLEVKDLGKLKSNYGEEMEIETNLEQDISINEINMEDQVPPIIEPSFSMQINEATVDDYNNERFLQKIEGVGYSIH
ncbi:18686_t:CDS:2, partial [Entrophospora sp. SA101]